MNCINNDKECKSLKTLSDLLHYKNLQKYYFKKLLNDFFVKNQTDV